MQEISLAQALVLALIQGLTEFLPISSSAHLALLPRIAELPDQGLAFDTTVHLGTLTAVVVYFRKDLAAMLRGWARTIALRRWDADPHGRLAWLVAIATIPVGLAGLALKDFVEEVLRDPVVIAWASIGFGILLWWADRKPARRPEGGWTLGEALAVGVAQALALIPGTSRSGITMTAARFLGYGRKEAARFSFLLAIPVIALAGGLKLVDWWQAPQHAASAAALAVGYAASAISAWICIHFFLRFIERIGMTPFVVYRVLLGVALLAWGG